MKAVARQLRQPDVGREPRVFCEPSAVLVEQLARSVCARFFDSTRSAGDLRDVGRLQVDLGKRSIRRASSICLSSSPLTSSLSFSCDVTTIQCLPRPLTPSSGRPPAGRASSGRRGRRTGRLRRRRTSATCRLAALHQFNGIGPPACPGGCRRVLDRLRPGVGHRDRSRGRARA